MLPRAMRRIKQTSRAFDRPPAGGRPTFEIEREFLARGFRVIAGVDEAGRGSLAGPLCIGLVVYDYGMFDNPPCELDAINDSKCLTPAARQRALNSILVHARCVETCMVSHRIVDRYNVNGATEYALVLLLGRLPFRPDIVLLDGNFRFNPGVPMHSIKKGDQRSLSIASASIAAKLRRDEVLDKLDLHYPGYGLSRNKGYGTLEHRRAIAALGPAAIHRRSYEPLKSMLAQSGLFDNEGSS